MDYAWGLTEDGSGGVTDPAHRVQRRLPPPPPGRGDFVGGIDNEALDFSQLEDFINDENDASNTYFADTLAHNEAPRTNAGGGTPTVAPPPPPPPPAATIVNVVVEPGGSPNHHITSVISSNNKTVRIPAPVIGTPVPYKAGTTDGTAYNPHNLPDSPPDSGSEPPYSPQEPSAHSPHQKSVPQEMILHHGHIQPPQHHLYHPAHHMKPSQQAQPQPHMPETLLIQHPVLTPLLSQGTPSPPSTNPPQAQTPISLSVTATSTGPTIQNLGLVPNPLALAAAHAGLTNEHSSITTLYSSLQGGSKKRKLSQDGGTPAQGNNAASNGPAAGQPQNLNNVVHVKQEPELSPDSSSNQTGVLDDDYGFEIPGESGMYLESSYQCIRFQPFQQTSWHVLCDQNLKELPVPHYRVDADKGFNFSNADDAFVCQKKNHFQITCHAQLQGDAQFVKTPEGLKKISSFHLHFYGVKVESPTQTIKVEQSQSDRSKKPFHPVLVDLQGEQVTKVTVGRLHFSETTSNNMRKKGKPNPDQRYFYLVVGLHAHCADANNYPIVSHASERIIVRASNPGQFESDVELCWQKGHTPESIFHAGRVGINTDRPDEALVIHGNLKVTGHIVQPSDQRAKEIIQECDPREQLQNVQQLRVVRYRYAPGFALHAGLTTDTNLASDTGVIAQDVQRIIPEAVHSAGDITLPNGHRINNLLLVNKDRIYMENVGAVKELCRVTHNLETRIEELERISRKLAKLNRVDSCKSSSSISTVSTKSSGSRLKHKKHQHSCQENSDCCSNRAIQITIVMLVLVMALCLATIAALYFLECLKGNRRDYNNYHDITSSRSFQSSVPLINSPHNFNSNATQMESTMYPPPNPLNTPTSKAPSKHTHHTKDLPSWHHADTPSQRLYMKPTGSSIPLVSSSRSSQASTSDSTQLGDGIPEADLFGSPSATYNGATKVSPPVVGRPQECSPITNRNANTPGGSNGGLHPYLETDTSICQIFCCPVELPHLEEHQDPHTHLVTTPARLAASDNRASRQFTLHSSSSLNQRMTPATNALDDHKKHIKSQQHTYASSVEPSNNQALIKEPTTWVKPHTLKKPVDMLLRKRRDTDDWNDAENANTNLDASSDPDQLGISICIKGRHFNQTLGAEFCSVSDGTDFGSCMDHAYNYTYTIPLSRYMPDDSLLLQFNFKNVARTQLAEHCQTQFVQPFCEWNGHTNRERWSSDVDTDNHNQRPQNGHATFTVEVGIHTRMTLRYRVQLIQTVTNLCLLPKDKLGIDFLEYNFLFYRDCEE